MSKGSGRRPQQAPDDMVVDSWKRIFSKKQNEQEAAEKRSFPLEDENDPSKHRPD